MGQYYRPVLSNENETSRVVYNRYVDGEYTMAKLMEHSWWLNPFTSTICSRLYKNPRRVAWVGDYADEYGENGSHPCLLPPKCKRLCNSAWKGEGIGIKSNLFYLDHRYLVDHSSEQFIDCQKYYLEADCNGWCVHPLPLLTAVGNGFGGGDYRGTNEEKVGIWANDIISIEDEPPEKYEEILIIFKEEF